MTVSRLLYIDGDIFDFVMYYIYGQSGPSLYLYSAPRQESKFFDFEL